jgi:hypothetical protein
MKRLILLILLLSPLLAWGQIFHIDPTTHKLTYTEVTEVAGAPQSELYDRARRWFDFQYAYATDVALSEHEEEGELRIQSELPLKVSPGSSGVVRYTFTLSVKEGKYRYLITDFTFRYPDRQPLAFEDPRMHPQMKIFFKTDERVQLLLAGLHQKMIRKVTAQMDDW